MSEFIRFPQIRTVRRGETEVVACNFTASLASAESLTSISTSITTSTNVNAANPAISTGYTERETGATVANAKAAMFTVSPTTNALTGLYEFSFFAVTNASTSYSRTLKGEGRIRVIN